MLWDIRELHNICQPDHYKMLICFILLYDLKEVDKTGGGGGGGGGTIVVSYDTSNI